MAVKIEITGSSTCPFLRKNDIYQDGTTPMYRDTDGTLWAMSGHSHMGHIGMFSGKTLEDLEHRYPIHTNFCVGHADYATSNTPTASRPVAASGPSACTSAPIPTGFSASSTTKPAGTARVPAMTPWATAQSLPTIPTSAMWV